MQEAETNERNNPIETNMVFMTLIFMCPNPDRLDRHQMDIKQDDSSVQRVLALKYTTNITCIRSGLNIPYESGFKSPILSDLVQHIK
ncbi:hypothetical protein GCM10022397_06060 [Flavivirga jejuensis]